MFNKIALIALATTFFVGCASVPMESKEDTAKAKQFATPPAGQAGLYVYRNSSIGGALKKDVLVDGKCIGQTAPDVFFYEVVAGDTEHKISTESEFSPNDLMLKTESGKNYFVRQFIKMGVFVGGAGLEVISEDQAKKDIAPLNMAKKGECTK